MTGARLVSIHVTPTAANVMQSVSEAEATPGAGILEDRYALGIGTFSDVPGTGREVTLIEREAVDAYVQESGHAISPGDMRRNLVTEGVRLNDLVGREFQVGEVRLRGMRLCEPCTTLQRMLGGNVLKGFVHRGGLRAGFVSGGVLRVGDAIMI